MRQSVYNVLAAMPEPRTGRLWPGKSIRRAFENAVAAAKLDDFTFHDLRHHFASWFMMRGGSLQALREIPGHRDIKMTLPLRPPGARAPAQRDRKDVRSARSQHNVSTCGRIGAALTRKYAKSRGSSEAEQLIRNQ
jgi:hypothetical protein